MPVGFARSLLGGTVFIPKETVIRITGVSSQSTGLFQSTAFTVEKDEMSIANGTVGSVNGRSYSIINGTYNMKITANSSASISTSLTGSNISSSATIGKGKFVNVNDPSTWSFNVSKNYSGTRSGTTGSVPLDNVNLPYDFGTVTFSSDGISVVSGLTTGSGNTMGTPSWTITLYEIAS